MKAKKTNENTKLFYTKRGKKIDLNKVVLWASRHLTIENMAALIGISKTSLYETIEENEQFGLNFYAAIESGKAQGVEMVTNKLLELCEEGHPQSIYFFLERKGGFNKVDTVKNEITGKDGTPLQLPTFNIVGVVPKNES
jgi:hypothetical protein